MKGNPSRPNPILAIFKDLIHYGFEIYGRYYSSYRGFVYDNVDPLNLQRVQLIIPEVGGDHPFNYWAHPKGIFAGPGYGMQMIPQKGELVWVEFEGGHPEVPIYSLGYFGNNELPEGDELKDLNCYWFKSPYGHLITVNDTKKTITIRTTLGHKVVMNDADNYIDIVTHDNHYVLLNSKDNVVRLNHKSNQYVDIRDGGTSIVSKSISLGTQDTSAQKAMLGDATKELLTIIKDYLSSLTTTLTSDALSLITDAPNTIAALPEQILRVEEISLKLEQILSSKNTLD